MECLHHFVREVPSANLSWWWETVQQTRRTRKREHFCQTCHWPLCSHNKLDDFFATSLWPLSNRFYCRWSCSLWLWWCRRRHLNFRQVYRSLSVTQPRLNVDSVKVTRVHDKSDSNRRKCNFSHFTKKIEKLLSSPVNCSLGDSIIAPETSLSTGALVTIVDVKMAKVNAIKREITWRRKISYFHITPAPVVGVRRILTLKFAMSSRWVLCNAD